MDNFKNVIGYEGIKHELRVIADILREPEKYSKLGAKTPAGILLVGPPGTGKTTMAKAFLKECGCKSFIIRKDRFNDSFIDDIRKTFEKAKKVEGPAVILLDDIDKFENNDEHHVNGESFVTVQSCIDEVKGEGVLVIATSNELHAMPDSLLRAGRFDTTLTVNHPSDEDAEKIVKHYLSIKNCKGIDSRMVSRILNGASCAELETIVNQAAIIAGSKNHQAITMDDIVSASLRVIFDAPEIEEGYNKDTLHRLAVHEAGHALISEVLRPGSVNIVALTRTEGSAGAVTSVFRKNEGIRTYDGYVERILVSMGGKASSEVVSAEIDTGCYSDMRKAYNLVDGLVDDLCAFGFDTKTETDYMDSPSQATMARKDARIAEKMTEFYSQAKKILIENREFLDMLIRELEEKIVVTAYDIDEIRKHLGENDTTKEVFKWTTSVA